MENTLLPAAAAAVPGASSHEAFPCVQSANTCQYASSCSIQRAPSALRSEGYTLAGFLAGYWVAVPRGLHPPRPNRWSGGAPLAVL
jgi:hypothetical protein